MLEVKVSSQRWKGTRRKLCPTNQGGENVMKVKAIITVKTLRKVTGKHSLKLRMRKIDG